MFWFWIAAAFIIGGNFGAIAMAVIAMNKPRRWHEDHL
jgi:D-alanyl-lipoteichoic acid acyltransferase DltB (MBOAT superfamily)